MKKILLLVPVAVLISCKKESQPTAEQNIPISKQQSAYAPPYIPRGVNSSSQHQGSVTGWFYTGVYSMDAQAWDIQGVSVSADYQRLRLTAAYMRAFYVASYYLVQLPEGTQQRWIQFGYINDPFGNRIFFEVFNISGPQGGVAPYDQPVNYFNTFVYPTLNSKVDFRIYNAGGNLFRLSCNGSDLGEMDLGTNTLSPTGSGGMEIMSETQDATTFPDEINSQNVSTLQTGTWSILPTANVKTATWPIEGHDQDSSLAIGEFNMGGNKGTIYPTPTQLW